MTRWISRIAVALGVLCVGYATPATPQTNTGPLRLSFECNQKPELTFRFTIHNVSTDPTAAVVGTILANDKKYLLGPLSLTVRRAGAPDAHLRYVDFTVPGVAGRLDPWLVTLPAGASYSVAVQARNFLGGPELSVESFSAPAELQLRFTTQKVGDPNPDLLGLKFIRVWVGTLVSDRLKFPSQCKR